MPRQETLSSMSSKGLFSAMDANMGSPWSCYGLAKGGVLHRRPDVTWFYTGLQSSSAGDSIYQKIGFKDVCNYRLYRQQ